MGKTKKKNSSEGNITETNSNTSANPNDHYADNEQRSKKRKINFHSQESVSDPKKNKNTNKQQTSYSNCDNTESVEIKQYQTSSKKKNKAKLLQNEQKSHSKKCNKITFDDKTSKLDVTNNTCDTLSVQSKEDHQENITNIDSEKTKLHSDKSKKKSKKKNNKLKPVEQIQNGGEDKKSIKIRFIDDDPKEVPSNESAQEKKIKQNMNDEEALVNDEDIDKFCDEIDEVDNVQFEDWVKLLEAKLGNNKK